MKRIFLVFLLFSFLSPSFAVPLLGDLRVRSGFYLTDFSSSLQFDRNNITGTKVNLNTDLDLENNTVVPFVEAWLGGKFTLNLAYADSSYEDKARTASKITIDGVTLTDGLGTKQVSVDIDFRTFDLASGFFPLFTSKIGVGAFVGIKYFYYKGRFINETDGIGVDRDEETLLPYFGVEAHFSPIPLLDLHTRIRGGSYEWSDVDIRRHDYFEFEIGATLRIGPIGGSAMLGFTIEYRYFEVRVTKGAYSNTARYTTKIDAVVFSLVVQI